MSKLQRKKKKKRQKTGGRSDNVIINELKKERDVDRYGFARNSAWPIRDKGEEINHFN